jgi:cysteine sulfinate desulfinase/cysteine desulfurase-like protein/rhodanese-related sulfurtransferase
MNTEIYLDSNATTSVLPAALEAAVHALSDGYGNPSSSHSSGLRARAIVRAARAAACRVLGVGNGRLMFNSGATEGIQTAVLSALCSVREQRDQGMATGTLLLYGATEHKAVPESLAHWNRVLGLNLELRALAVDRDGRHDLAQLRALGPQAALVCTMAANNETGAVSDLGGIAAALEGSRALWLVDCVQALGKLPLDLAATRIDYAPFSGHKIYAPKGVGMLYVRCGAPYTPLLAGGGQEDGLRAGTENVPGIAALGAVLVALEQGGGFNSPEGLATMRHQLVESLTASFPVVIFNTPLGNSLPTTLNVSVAGLTSGQLLDVFDAAGVRVSAGSACSAAAAKPSYVLEAMGLPAWQAANAVRISFGPGTSKASIDEACLRIRHCGSALRQAGVIGSASEKPANAQAAFDACNARFPDLEGDTRRDADGEAAARMHLDASALRQLLLAHPETRLIDVRERFEHLASPRGGLMGHALNVPAVGFFEALPAWLASPEAPIVFVCRSGRRSERAAHCLRTGGHGRAFHLAGGIALAEPALLFEE